MHIPFHLPALTPSTSPHSSQASEVEKMGRGTTGDPSAWVGSAASSGQEGATAYRHINPRETK